MSEFLLEARLRRAFPATAFSLFRFGRIYTLDIPSGNLLLTHVIHVEPHAPLIPTVRASTLKLEPLFTSNLHNTPNTVENGNAKADNTSLIASVLAQAQRVASKQKAHVAENGEKVRSENSEKNTGSADGNKRRRVTGFDTLPNPVTRTSKLAPKTVQQVFGSVDADEGEKGGSAPPARPEERSGPVRLSLAASKIFMPPSASAAPPPMQFGSGDVENEVHDPKPKQRALVKGSAPPLVVVADLWDPSRKEREQELRGDVEKVKPEMKPTHRLVCFLCVRQFDDEEAKRDHEDLSTVHQANLALCEKYECLKLVNSSQTSVSRPQSAMFVPMSAELNASDVFGS